MDDVTEELSRSEHAVHKLAKRTPGRWLRFELVDRNGTGYEKVEFYQAELGFIPIQDFFNRVRRELKNIVDGEAGVKLGELFSDEIEMPKLEGASSADVNKLIDENMMLIKAVLDLVQRVPDFELDLICLALGVPTRSESYVEWIKQGFAEPPYRGGLTKAEGFDIMINFIRDNAEAVRRFFTDDLQSLLDEVKKTLGLLGTVDVDGAQSTGGMPSNTSSLDTLASPLMT